VQPQVSPAASNLSPASPHQQPQQQQQQQQLLQGQRTSSQGAGAGGAFATDPSSTVADSGAQQPGPAHDPHDVLDSAEAVRAAVSEIMLHEELCDAVLVVEGRRFPVVRALLSCWSPYFRAMFTNGMAEQGQREIELQEIDADALELVLTYMCSGRIQFTTDNAIAVLNVAHRYQLAALLQGCKAFLKTVISDATCCQLLVNCCGDGDVEFACREYITAHFQTVKLTQGFFMLSAHHLSSVLDSDELDMNEEDIFRAAISWIDHGREERAGHADELLAHVRLPLIPPDRLALLDDVDEVLQGSRTFQRLLLEAFKYATNKQSVVADGERFQPRVGKLPFVDPSDDREHHGNTTIFKFRCRKSPVAVTFSFSHNGQRKEFSGKGEYRAHTGEYLSAQWRTGNPDYEIEARVEMESRRATTLAWRSD